MQLLFRVSCENIYIAYALLLEIKPMLLQWQRIKPTIYIYTSSGRNEQYNSSFIHSLSFTSKPLLTVADLAYPCSVLQLHIESTMRSSQFHLNISLHDVMGSLAFPAGQD